MGREGDREWMGREDEGRGNKGGEREEEDRGEGKRREDRVERREGEKGHGW